MIAPRVLSLVKVYETGSFTKAAALLGRTQPAVSQHICALESELGITIFDRSHTPLTVTPEGMYVIHAARKIIDAAEELDDTLVRYRNGARTLKIGLTGSEELYGITRAFAAVLSEDDGLTIETTRYNYNHMVTMLLHDDIDVALSFGDIEISSDYGRKLCDRDRLMLAVSRSNPLSSRESVKLEEVLSEKLVMFSPETGIGRYVETAISASEIPFDRSNVRLVTEDLKAAAGLCEKGKAVSLVPEKVFRKIIGKNTVLVPVDEFSSDIPINIYFNVASGFSRTIDRILDHYSREK